MKPEFFRWDTGKKFIDLLNFINQFFCVSGNKVNYCVLDIMNKFLEENFDINDLETFYINEINIELTYTTVISNCKDLDSFKNSPQVTYNRFLVIYEDVFNQFSSKDLNILFNICISNNDLVRSLISDSNYFDLESIIDGIKTVIDKYKHIETYKTLIHHVTQNYQKFLVIYHDLFNQLNPKQLDLLCSICISNNGLVKLLISNLNPLSLENRTNIIKTVIDKYGNDDSLTVRLITQLFNILAYEHIKHNLNKNDLITIDNSQLEALTKYNNIPINWSYLDGVPFDNNKYCKLLGSESFFLKENS
ncbi:MAG: hypothetical protein RLZZ81_1177 [Pseudomonadota bacterium]|jgi:hypothetical protein